MESTLESKTKQGACSYCGDAHINHKLKYVENLIAAHFDSHMVWVTNHAPMFMKDLANWIPIILFNTLRLFKLAHFSSDIEKTNSFRSRVIWEEAQRRGIDMQQVILGKKPIDWYRAKINGNTIYFESIPIQSEFLDFKKDWDDKIILKRELSKEGIPVPMYKKLSPFSWNSLKHLYSQFKTPVIVKPKAGSRARHTVTNIHSFEHFKEGIRIVRQISPYLVVEEHLYGHVCRATLIGGVLAGFYKGELPFIIGDGEKTIKELIEEKDAQRIERYHFRITNELHSHISRSGFSIDDILLKGTSLPLSHRTGQLFGGMTEEMIDELHPSFIPILEKAARITGLSVLGFDCIIPDPTKDQSSQRWGIIECNTLPFINMHYYALKGTPRNIAGMIWDLWG